VLARHIDIFDVDAVLVSHLHPDHCFDLAGFYVALRYTPYISHPRVLVYGSAGIASRMAAAYGIERSEGMTEEFDFHEWSDGATYEIGPLRVTVSRVAHPVECYAMRVEHGGRVLAYSGDTGASEALISLARDADLLLCEASNIEGGDNPPDLHLTGREAGEHAAKAGVARLVLTHVPPWYDGARAVAEAAPAFHGPIELARPGTSYEI
jgi:ribonuclease BN (tRNA processing enzyme)